MDPASDLFLACTTFDAVQATLNLKFTPHPIPKAAKSMPRPTTSVLLEGNSSTVTKRLFVFTDGSGSAKPYMNRSKVPSNAVIHDLGYPYMKQPENLNASLQELTALYVSEIRRRQPTGPYNFRG
ncbi:hypothetical protein P152DRAFT_449758 [Eremomyces bilateralis CBS 781.70]|uniref:Uncharacterized protein n=1 Tax=Eremomyces bilateralis CBS 781.70 TaxID=1392243 RepID=A0A6G1G208_9PEZI|nr:uncharacterized protein P152DRAFT_449758 [Eremomyces bilateralis CBS 781.70]KAF1811960.1 hypothetical protein P152DRAFT_449758 [Eremomyces bilateralis CBS 781.70]